MIDFTILERVGYFRISDNEKAFIKDEIFISEIREVNKVFKYMGKSKEHLYLNMSTK